MGKNNTYQRSDKKFGDYPYLIHLSRGCMGCNPTEESPMLQYNMEVKEENDAFGGWGEVEVPAKKVFMLINTSDYQGDGPCVQFMCGWKDFELNGFTEEDYYHCMMKMDINEMVNCSKAFECDYEGVLIVCVAANSHMDYIKRELEEQPKPYTIPVKFCGVKLTDEQWDEFSMQGWRDWLELNSNIKGMTFLQVVDKYTPKLSRLHNNTGELFHCYYKSILAIVRRTEDGKCSVDNTAIVYVSINNRQAPGSYKIIFTKCKGDYILTNAEH